MGVEEQEMRAHLTMIKVSAEMMEVIADKLCGDDLSVAVAEARFLRRIAEDWVKAWMG